MGFGGFHIHSRTGMAEKYLGERFMNFVKFSTDYAKKNGMYTYLYDEDRYFSGYAGGYVTKNPKYRSKSLHFTTKEMESFLLDEAQSTGKPYLVGIFDVSLNDRGELTDYARIDKSQPIRGTRWFAYIVTAKPDPWFNNCAYVDTLCKDAINEFVKITYGAYRSTVGNDFGKFVPSMFTDEPHAALIHVLERAAQSGNVVLPWTYSLPDEFSKKYGYDISKRIPEIVWNLPNGEISEARYDYYDFRCEMFAKNYNKPFENEEEILRLDNICRGKKGWPLRSESFVQPWVVPEVEPADFVTLKFCINSSIEVDNALLAIEDAEKLEICFNGKRVKSDVVGYYVDHAIKTVCLPRINIGANDLTVRIPFGQLTNIEWCYILGEFGVQVRGSECLIVPLPDKIGFSDLTSQGMPFYGGNIVYKTQIDTPECNMVIHTPNYRGALTKVYVDGAECGVSAFAPYAVRADNLCAGIHTVEFELFGTRINTFGGLHNVTKPGWINSSYWRTTGDNWSYEHQFWKNGILSAPRIDIT